MEYRAPVTLNRGASQATLPTIQKFPNPLLGESEGEGKRKVVNEQYREYLRKSMERSNENSLSKSAKKRLLVLQNSPKHSPKEPNIYAQK